MRVGRALSQAWNSVGLSVADNRLLIEGVRVLILEGSSLRNERVGDDLAGGLADAELDAGRIDALLVD